MTSAVPVSARRSAAAANPSWTATVRIGRSRDVVCHSTARSGPTADALNHGAKASNTPAARIASCRPLPAGSDAGTPGASPARRAPGAATKSTPAVIETVAAGRDISGGSAASDALVALDGQHEDGCPADLDLERVGHEELAGLHDRRHRVHDLRSGVARLADDPEDLVDRVVLD